MVGGTASSGRNDGVACPDNEFFHPDYFFARRATVSEQDVSRRQFFVKLGVVFNGLAAAVLAVPVVGYLLAPIMRARGRTLSQVDRLRRTGRISRGPDAPGEVQEPYWQIRGTARRMTFPAGSAMWRASVPGLRDQLRSPGLPGALVPAIGVVHVSLPRRRLLCGRFARFRPPPSAGCSNTATKLETGNL